MSLSQLILETCLVTLVFECPLFSQNRVARVHVCFFWSASWQSFVPSSSDAQEVLALCPSVLIASSVCTDANLIVSFAKPARKIAAFTQSPTDLYSAKWRLLHSCTPTQDSKAVQDVKGENQRQSDHCDCWEGDQTLSRGPNEKKKTSPWFSQSHESVHPSQWLSILPSLAFLQLHPFVTFLFFFLSPSIHPPCLFHLPTTWIISLFKVSHPLIFSLPLLLFLSESMPSFLSCSLPFLSHPHHPQYPSTPSGWRPWANRSRCDTIPYTVIPLSHSCFCVLCFYVMQQNMDFVFSSKHKRAKRR